MDPSTVYRLEGLHPRLESYEKHHAMSCTDSSLQGNCSQNLLCFEVWRNPRTYELHLLICWILHAKAMRSWPLHVPRRPNQWIAWPILCAPLLATQCSFCISSCPSLFHDGGWSCLGFTTGLRISDGFSGRPRPQMRKSFEVTLLDERSTGQWIPPVFPLPQFSRPFV